MNSLNDRASFEAALDAAAGYLANPPAAGSEGAETFSSLLAQIEAYVEKLPELPEPEAAAPNPKDDIGARLDDLKRRYDAAHPQAGEGIGPTLGMDLHHS